MEIDLAAEEVQTSSPSLKPLGEEGDLASLKVATQSSDLELRLESSDEAQPSSSYVVEEAIEPSAEERTDPLQSEQAEDSVEPFAQLQAILAGLPMHAVPPMPEAGPGTRSCGSSGAIVGQCAGCRRKASAHDLHTCKDRVEIALRRACMDYPDQQEALRQLEVEHASLDLVCFVDHQGQRLFTAARGTDRFLNPLTTPRDLSNDSLIAIGLNPYRTEALATEYQQVRAAFPFYASFGSGHSLGGNIVQAIAMQFEADEFMRFERIDVFNFGSTPFRFSPVKYSHTEHHVHRVPGDWASAWYKVPDGCTDRLHVHPPKPNVRSLHLLGHFLPDKAGELRPALLPPCPEEDEGSSGSSPDGSGLGFGEPRPGPAGIQAGEPRTVRHPRADVVSEFVFGSALGNALRPVNAADWPKPPLAPITAECQSGVLQTLPRKPSWFFGVMSSFNCVGSRNKDCAPKTFRAPEVQDEGPPLVD